MLRIARYFLLLFIHSLKSSSAFAAPPLCRRPDLLLLVVKMAGPALTVLPAHGLGDNGHFLLRTQDHLA